MSELKKRIKTKLVSVSYMFRETVEFPALKVTLYSTSLCTSVTLKKKSETQIVNNKILTIMKYKKGQRDPGKKERK